MCGILGILSPKESLTAVTNAFGTISYRGTLTGSFLDERLALYCTRLPRTGCRFRPQPVINDLGDAFCMNGEIYNADELCQEDSEYSDLSDSEILAKWLAKDKRNLDSLHLLEGEFSLVFVPSDRRSVVLARDCFGSKPLYWGKIGGLIAFGSSAKGVAAILHGSPIINPVEYSDMFWFGISETGSCFDRVIAVPSGTALTISEDGNCTRHPISRFRSGDTLLKQLSGAVKRRLSIPSRTFVAFSGGVDSFLIHRLSASEGVKCLRLVAGTTRNTIAGGCEVECSAANLHSSIAQYCRVSEKPLISLSGPGIFLLAQYARERGYEVALTGEGADELFCGYSHYYKASLGHPYAILGLQTKETVLNLLGAKSKLGESPLVKQLIASASPIDWLRSDREYRLPQHLCSCNNDIPMLLAGIESRLPYLGVADFARATICKLGPKKQLYTLAATFGLKSLRKRGLAIGGLSLRQFMDSYIEETDWTAAFERLSVDSRNIQSRIRDTWTKVNTNVLPIQVRDYVREALARFIMACWSADRIFEISKAHCANAFTKLSAAGKCVVTGVPNGALS